MYFQSEGILFFHVFRTCITFCVQDINRCRSCRIFQKRVFIFEET
ncbi:unnamed protein product [Brugia timori]|uniref:Uncharacterized protein n=1 Tax=Brugia timori TaxID=42155 RepID=A0A3P7TI38_9BILA|nr:unnamed protein product [Brugia timori]